MTTTPTTTPTKAPDAPPHAPIKPGSRGVMSVEEAKRLKPEDIGVSFGRPMTEEEFAEYRRRRGGRPVRVIN